MKKLLSALGLAGLIAFFGKPNKHEATLEVVASFTPQFHFIPYFPPSLPPSKNFTSHTLQNAISYQLSLLDNLSTTLTNDEASEEAYSRAVLGIFEYCQNASDNPVFKQSLELQNKFRSLIYRLPKALERVPTLDPFPEKTAFTFSSVIFEDEDDANTKKIKENCNNLDISDTVLAACGGVLEELTTCNPYNAQMTLDWFYSQLLLSQGKEDLLERTKECAYKKSEFAQVLNDYFDGMPFAEKLEAFLPADNEISFLPYLPPFKLSE